jgi:hypothetical protein
MQLIRQSFSIPHLLLPPNWMCTHKTSLAVIQSFRLPFETFTMCLLVLTTNSTEIITHYLMISRFGLSHLLLLTTFSTGRPCSAEGNFLPPGSPPTPLPAKSRTDWGPFSSRLEFELADFLYSQSQMPAVQIDALLDIWGTSLLQLGGEPLFANHMEMYRTVDNIDLGDVKWSNFTVQYTGVRPPGIVPSWMEDTYEVYFHDPREVVRSIVANPQFACNMDYCHTENMLQRPMNGGGLTSCPETGHGTRR